MHKDKVTSDIGEWFETLSNWGRWGPEDERGTLNHITPAIRARAAALISDGEVVSCSRIIDTNRIEDETAPTPARMMLSTGQGIGDEHRVGPGPHPRMGHAGEFWGLAYHGNRVTHLDSLGHIFWDQSMYNGFPAKAVTSEDGATKGDVLAAQNGVVTRGVLVDMARIRDVPWLETPVTVDDLEAWEALTGASIGQGDALLLRTGSSLAKTQDPSLITPGWHAECLHFFQERQVALISADTRQDTLPSGHAEIQFPIHSIGITAMGLWLLDYGAYDALAEACIERNRWEFFFVVTPIAFRGATGSPVNPIAIF